MPMELLVKLAARMRQLSEPEFKALRDMVETGHEEQRHMPAVAQCLIDLTDTTNKFNDEELLPRLNPERNYI